jgi:hypothetical protein
MLGEVFFNSAVFEGLIFPIWDPLFSSVVSPRGLLLMLLFLQLLVVCGIPSLDDDSFFHQADDSYFNIGNAISSSLIVGILLRHRKKGEFPKGRVLGSKTRRPKRSLITDIFEEYGPIYFRRAYRMEEKSFWRLLHLLEPKMGVKRSRKRGATPNGPVCNSVRLAMALRYFAGGDPLDIALVYHVSRDLVYKSAWLVVDAIHQTKQLDIKFPTSHEEQLLVAKQFEEKSTVKFSNCAGCIDGILIWINKPSNPDLATLKIGGRKFFCTRKKNLD